MVTKKLRQGCFKEQKLSKTRDLRKRQELERRLSDRREHSRRNDLRPDLKFSQVAVGDLSPSPNRARKTTPQQLERIISSIAEHAFCVPILISGNTIVDGHVRVEAARRLEMENIPAIECSHLSPAEMRRLALALNRTAELGEWDLDQLKIEFTELLELDLDLLSTGFSAQETEIIILDGADEQEDASQDEQVDEPPAEPVTRLGDVWLLGGHRVICGDALEAATYEAVLKNEVAHAVLTDPPYNVKIQGNVSGLGKKVHDEFVQASGELNDEEWQAFLNAVLAMLIAHVAAGAVLFVFMDWRSVHRVYQAGFASGLKLINLVVWYKQSGAMGALYRSSHELLPVFCKGDKPRVNNVELGRHGRDRQNVWLAPGANRKGSSANEMLGQHATPKPVELCIDAILDVTNRGETVLDAFLGSGTTLIAAQKSGRLCRGIELEPRFVDVAILRWQRLTGGDAVHAATGESFHEVAQRRSREAEETLETAAQLAAPTDEGGR